MSNEEFKSFAAIDALYPLSMTMEEDTGYITIGHFKKEINRKKTISLQNLQDMMQKAEPEYTETEFEQLVTGGPLQAAEDEINAAKKDVEEQARMKEEFAKGLKNMKNEELAAKGKELFKMMFPETKPNVTKNPTGFTEFPRQLVPPVRTDLRPMYQQL